MQAYNTITKLEKTELGKAIVREDLSAIKALIEKGIDVNEKDVDLYTPFVFAAKNVNSPEVLHFLAEHGANINAKAETGMNALMTACFYNSEPKVTKALVEDFGMDVNEKECVGKSAIFHAAGNNNPEIIRYLAERGADVNACDELGLTPLMWAAFSNKNPEIIKTLIELGADVSAMDEDGHNALYWAEEAMQKIPAIINILSEQTKQK